VSNLDDETAHLETLQCVRRLRQAVPADEQRNDAQRSEVWSSDLHFYFVLVFRLLIEADKEFFP
jgi:hypothetical protein